VTAPAIAGAPAEAVPQAGPVHPAGAAARRLAGEVLAPRAAAVDVSGVERATLDALAGAGLYGLLGPREYGGGEAPPAVIREVNEVLSGACGSTWFVLTQHTLPLVMTSRTDNAGLKERMLAGLCTGALRSGVAVAHVRRPGPPAVRAVRAGTGWRVDGTVAWCTGWGLVDVVLLAAQTADDDLVFALLPAAERPGLRPAGELALAAMGGTRTYRLELDGLAVLDEEVVAVVAREDWLAEDAARTANVTPAVFGVLHAVTGALDALGDQRDLPAARTLAVALAAEGAQVRASAYALIDGVPAGERIDDRLACRAAALELTVRASAALVAAAAGSAMLLSAAPQRWAREALFHLVQAQTRPVREATLARFAESSRGMARFADSSGDNAGVADSSGDNAGVADSSGDNAADSSGDNAADTPPRPSSP